MRRKIFSIWSVLLILLISIAVLLPGCDSSDGEEEPTAILDHFKCYPLAVETHPSIEEIVLLEDQFGGVEAVVENYAGWFCNPVEILHDDVLTPISNPNHHLTSYFIALRDEPQTWFVEVYNQFGTQELTVEGPVQLAVPTQKVEPGHHESPVGLDHFMLYLVIEGPSIDVNIILNDQFGGEPDALVYEYVLFANPVRKIHGTETTEIVNPEEHLVFYLINIDDEPFETQVQVDNQFGDQTLYLMDPLLLAVPSEKISWEERPSQ